MALTITVSTTHCLNNQRKYHGHLINDFAEKAQLIVKSWKLQNHITWRDKGAKSAIDNIINPEVGKHSCRMWENRRVNISAHIMIVITCEKIYIMLLAKKIYIYNVERN